MSRYAHLRDDASASERFGAIDKSRFRVPVDDPRGAKERFGRIEDPCLTYRPE